MSLQKAKDISLDPDALQHALEKQTRRADIAERVVENTRKALNDEKDANIQLEADLITLRADNERLRELLIQAKADAAAASALDSEVSGQQETDSEELTRLQEQYAQLLSEKNALRERYYSEATGWKRFKKWYYVTHGRKELGNAKAPGSPSRARRRSINAIMSSPSKSSATRRGSQTSPRKIGSGANVDPLLGLVTPASPIANLISRRATKTRIQDQNDENPFSQPNHDPMSTDEGEDMDGEPLPKMPLTPTRNKGKARVPLSPSCMNSGGSSGRKRRRMEADLFTETPVSPLRPLASSEPEPLQVASPPKAAKATPMGMLLQSRLPGSSKAADTTRLAEQYAQFKGRGRYGKAAAAALPAPVATTANPVKYDEVVRGRDKRKHLHAEDCECCHEYYESAKPQPQRLQRPLWRSPKAKGMMDADTTVAIASNEETRENVEAHKHTISRHRHVWQAPQTPPGYWDISFPTTQEVAEINQEALSRRR